MTIKVTITDGHVDGYLTPKEYAIKHGLKENTVRIWICRDKIDTLTIGSSQWIKSDTPIPLPKKRRRRSKTSRSLQGV